MDARAKRQADLGKEAGHFSGKNNDRVRSLAWSAIPYFQRKIHERIDIGRKARELLACKSEIAALTLACGDMTGEYRLLKSLGAKEIVAYDVSEGQRERFRDRVDDGSVKVDYRIGDVNEVDLPKNAFDVVYMQQSLHHIEAVEAVLSRIHDSLKADGVFVLNDYIGEPFLQRTEKQRAIARRIWKQLPERLRIMNGEVKEDIHIPAKSILSPFEAIRSDAIYPALKATFTTHCEFTFAGILFPVVNNFAPNYDLEKDDTLIRLLWEMDEMLVENGVVEPNFIRGLYLKRA
jgi:SAM-dependent methyltransferase